MLPAAIEELLRLVSPIHSFSRSVTRDTELHGKALKEGDTILMVYPAANRDEREFDEPDSFILDRNPVHVAFGVGNHFCLGANLARMEMRVAFRELLKRLPDMEYAGDGPQIRPSPLVRTCEHMQVKYTPESNRR